MSVHRTNQASLPPHAHPHRPALPPRPNVAWFYGAVGAREIAITINLGLAAYAAEDPSRLTGAAKPGAKHRDPVPRQSIRVAHYKCVPALRHRERAKSPLARFRNVRS